MVYLAEVISKKRNELLMEGRLQTACYYYVVNKKNLPKDVMPDLGDEETLAFKGYLGIAPLKEEIRIVTSRKPIRQIDYTKNIFKLLGIHLATDNLISEKINIKFEDAAIKYKYLICKVLPDYLGRFKKALQNSLGDDSPYREILQDIYLNKTSDEIEKCVSELIVQDMDVIDLLILEDLQQKRISQSLKIKYINMRPEGLVRQVLIEFGNAVKKLTHDRRKDHLLFEINDEYDVQDLLYFALKPLFPNLIPEDPAPKVGPTSTKIDLVIREWGIVIEIKMIKKSDKDEKRFVSQLKEDIESYYTYPEIKQLLVFVYDPENKTTDRAHFYSLNGVRENHGIRFNVEVIVGN